MISSIDERIVHCKLFKIVSNISESFTKRFLLERLEKSFTFSEFFGKILMELKDEFIRNLIKNKSTIRRGKYKIKILEAQKMNMVVATIKIFNTIDRYFIPKGVFEELKRSYELNNILTSRFNSFEESLIGLIYRYTILWEYEEFLSKGNLKILHEELGCNIECFSSPLYRTLERYCSMFEEDRIFASMGNFFSVKSLTYDGLGHDSANAGACTSACAGVHANASCAYAYAANGKYDVHSFHGISAEVNPPYVDEIIERTLERIFEFVSSNIPCSFVLSLPRDREINSKLSVYVAHKFEMPIKINIYTKYLQRIELRKELNVYIIQNSKGAVAYPVTERFKRRFIAYNEESDKDSDSTISNKVIINRTA
jgi:hypothetical protein